MTPFTLLGWLVDATLKGSVLVVLIAIAQQIIGDRVGARWRHALWLVVILRFLLPVAPASRWSVFNLLGAEQTVPMAVRASSSAPVLVGLPRATSGVAEALQLSKLPMIWRWILSAWLCGVAVLLMRSAVATVRVEIAIRRKRRGAALDDVDDVRRRLRIARDVRVIETDLVDAPALHGLVRPALLLPVNFAQSFGREELRHIALHELWHLRRFDVAVNWLLSAIEAIHWFNPLVWYAVSRIREERELACDELALSCLEEDERLGYGRTILKLLECFRTATRVPALVGIVNHKKKMKRRILMIASYTNRTRVPVLFVAALVVVGLVGLTDARGGEHHAMMKKLDPAAMETLEKLGQQRITIDVKDASFGELLDIVSNATGVVIAQSPAVATSPIQQARFTLHAENIPAHLLLHSSLLPFHLAPKLDEKGVTIDQFTEGDPTGQHIEFHRQMTGHGEGSGEGKLHGTTITMHVSNDSKSAVSDDGTLHREITCNIEENGVATVGKLVLDIAGVK